MADPRFFSNRGPFRLDDLSDRIGARLGPGVDGALQVLDVAAIDSAGPGHLTYFQGGAQKAANAESLGALTGGACLVSEADAGLVPAGTAVVLAKEPRRAFALAAQIFYPRPGGTGLRHPSAVIDPTARLGVDVDVGANAVIGAQVEIGDRSVIGAGAVIGDGCLIGSDGWIGAQAGLSHCLIGDRVTILPAAHIGQDGFGVVPGPRGFTRVPQLGRVIIQDDVCIGTHTCIDRGAAGDTVIGEGTWIDNLVQVGHNVCIGRYCVIAAHVGISGSVTVEDFVAIGGQAGFADHTRVGQGAQIGAQAGVMRDVAPGERMLGAPAQPARQFFKAVAWLNRMAQTSKK